MTYDDRDRVIAWLADGHGAKLTTLDRAVLATIAQYVNSKTGHSWRGVEYLATVWGVDVRSVKRAITRLHRLGQIETAERGIGRRRARYRLAGEIMGTEIGGPRRPPIGTETGGPKQQNRGTETTEKGDLGVPRISKSSRSNNGEMTIDGATAPDSLGGSPGAAPTVAVHKQISETLNYTDDQTGKWIETKLAGRQPRNIDAYLLRCLNNQVADTAKATAGRSSTKKSAPKPESAKAGQSKKTSGKTAGNRPKKKRTGTPCKADGCDTNLVTPEAKWTGYCARHQSENRQHCKTEDCNHALFDLRAMKSGYCAKCSAADFSKPPVWSTPIQTDALGYIIERRPTLDGWANLLLKADIPANSTGPAAAETGGRLFNAIAKGLSSMSPGPMCGPTRLMSIFKPIGSASGSIPSAG
jgi:hypothetical protein